MDHCTIDLGGRKSQVSLRSPDGRLLFEGPYDTLFGAVQITIIGAGIAAGERVPRSWRPRIISCAPRRSPPPGGPPVRRGPHRAPGGRGRGDPGRDRAGHAEISAAL